MHDITKYCCFSLKSRIGSLEAENEELRNRPVAVKHISTPVGELGESKVQISKITYFSVRILIRFLQVSNICRL